MCVGGLDEDLGGIELRKKAKPRLINVTIEAIIIMKKNSYINTKNVIIIARSVKFINRSCAFFLI